MIQIENSSFLVRVILSESLLDHALLEILKSKIVILYLDKDYFVICVKNINVLLLLKKKIVKYRNYEMHRCWRKKEYFCLIFWSTPIIICSRLPLDTATHNDRATFVSIRPKGCILFQPHFNYYSAFPGILSHISLLLSLAIFWELILLSNCNLFF